jgi:hypothetical protein
MSEFCRGIFFFYISVITVFGSRDSSVGTVSRLRVGSLENWGSIPARGKRFLSSPQYQDHPVSYTMVLGVVSPGIKRQERESPPPSVVLKNGEIILPLHKRLRGVVLN